MFGIIRALPKVKPVAGLLKSSFEEIIYTLLMCMFGYFALHTPQWSHSAPKPDSEDVQQSSVESAKKNDTLPKTNIKINKK